MTECLANSGRFSGKSTRKCAPRLSSRASAPRAISRTTVAALESSPSSSAIAWRSPSASRMIPQQSHAIRAVRSLAGRPPLLGRPTPRRDRERNGCRTPHRSPRPRAEHHALQQRIAGQPVGAVHPGAGDLARRVQSRQAGTPVEVRPDSAHRIVRGRRDRRRLRVPGRSHSAGTSRKSAGSAPARTRSPDASGPATRAATRAAPSPRRSPATPRPAAQVPRAGDSGP